MTPKQKREMLAHLLEKRAGQPRRALLSFAQRRLWFLHQLAPGSAFYNMPIALRFTMPLDYVVLTDSLNEIVRRHETLRTTFGQRNDEPVQVIAPSLNLTIPITDLEPVADSEKQARAIAEEEARAPFDLAAGPLIRARLLRLGPTDHILLLTLHHVIADGWSLGVLFSELSTLYEAFRNGRPSPLPPLQIQYADYAAWQQKSLTGEVLDRELSYWKDQLEGLPELDLPTDRPRPAVATFRGARRFFTIPADIIQPLAAFGRTERATLFMTLLAAFQVVMHRYTGQEDFALGAPIANRTRSETEALIGFFVNTLVLRADVSGKPGFRELLRRTREMTLAAYAHQDLPFERLVEELHPDRDAARNPLVQVLFAVQNAPLPTPTSDPSQMEVWQVERHTANFDLVLDVWEQGTDLGGRIEYSTDLFDATTIERLLGHLETVLAAVVADPDRPVGLLPILTPAERRQILTEWNSTQRDYPSDTPMACLFERFAALQPQAPAVIFGSDQLTYGELNTRANQLAHHLRSRGIGTGDVLGIFMESSPAMIVAMLGILKAGAAYLPIPVNYPAELLTYVLHDSEPALVISDRQHATISSTGAALLDVSQAATAIHNENSANPASGVTADDVAYIMYTSGSSGRPKPIAITQRGVNRLVCNSNYMEVGPGDRFSQCSATSFDAATFEIWGALLNGACLVGVPKDTALMPQELASLLERESVTVAFFTTALFNQIAREYPEAFRIPRYVFFGGEAADPRWVREALHRGGCRRLIHVYGPTECTTYATFYNVEDVPGDAITVPIGRAIANTTVYVLDENREPLPVGIPGELYVGGPGLALGYWKHPELTAQSFVETLWGRLYRTGDLVRYRPDGALEFLGRRDTQVKIRGFRVELEEIKVILSACSGVRECVVTVREDMPGERHLVAYVVAESEDNAYTAERVEDWEKLYDEVVYEGIARHPAALRDPTFNIIGWKTTSSDRDIPAEQMREIVDQTVERIAALGATQVLEIGCGTGLLLFRLAQGCRRYWATDISQVALEYVRRHLTGRVNESAVRLFRRPADDFTGFDASGFDAVILNSVIQYFPGADYLARVIEGALSVLNPGGSLFIGDVRSLALLSAFHTSIELENAPATLATNDLMTKIERRSTHEQELAVAPAFFSALQHRFPKIREVSISPKRARCHNEVTSFRYDVVLRLASRPIAVGPSRYNWTAESWTVEKLARELRDGGLRDQLAGGVVFERVPNARTHRHAEAWRLIRDGSVSTAGELRDRLLQTSSAGVDPEQIWALSDEAPVTIEISWAQDYADGAFDIILLSSDRQRIDSASRPATGTAWAEHANNPRRGVLYQRLVPRILEHLQRSLPSYMIPSRFVLLDSLPLTPNGKVDYRALPTARQERWHIEDAYVPPGTPLETVLFAMWAEVLGLERMGITDNFFESGGHSLLATRLIARIREVLGVPIALRTLFANPTIRDFAAAIVASDPATRSKLEEAADLLLAVSRMTEEEAASMLKRQREDTTA